MLFLFVIFSVCIGIFLLFFGLVVIFVGIGSERGRGWELMELYLGVYSLFLICCRIFEGLFLGFVEVKWELDDVGGVCGWWIC